MRESKERKKDVIKRCLSNLKNQTLAADGRWKTGRFCEKLEQYENSGKKNSIMTAGNTKV